MRRFGIGKVGSFDPFNIHNGVCWAWPKECSLTNPQAKTIYYGLYKRRTLTMDQLIVIKKAMAHAWELTGGLPGGNYPGVKGVWSIVRSGKTADQKHHVIPQRIPTVEELHRAFNKEWSTSSPMSLVTFCQGLLAAYDLFIFGLRSTEDVKRVKKSVTHHHHWTNGWQATEFKGGRAKLCGTKKGTRPWRIWRTCHCPGKHHVRPPPTFFAEIRKDGNPRCAVKWCTVCPVAAVEFIFSLQADSTKRCYAKWLDSGRMGASNIGDVPAVAINWFVNQGAVTDANRYDRNAGRKSLGRWCGSLHVPYPESFQIHGDLPDTWASYQDDLPKSSFNHRRQSRDPKIATKGLRRFANYLGRGRKLKLTLEMNSRFQSDSALALSASETSISTQKSLIRLLLLLELCDDGWVAVGDRRLWVPLIELLISEFVFIRILFEHHSRSSSQIPRAQSPREEEPGQKDPGWRPNRLGRVFR